MAHEPTRYCLKASQRTRISIHPISRLIVLVGLLLRSPNLGLVRDIEPLARPVVVDVDLVQLAVVDIHDGLKEPQQDGLDVDHEAVGGDALGIDPHTRALDVFPEHIGEKGKHGFAALGSGAHDRIIDIEQILLCGTTLACEP